jgi:hypothetical protein
MTGNISVGTLFNYLKPKISVNYAMMKYSTGKSNFLQYLFLLIT